MEKPSVLYSEELIEFIQLNEIDPIELTTINPEDLLNFKNFNWRIMAEVLTFNEFKDL